MDNILGVHENFKKILEFAGDRRHVQGYQLIFLITSMDYLPLHK